MHELTKTMASAVYGSPYKAWNLLIFSFFNSDLFRVREIQFIIPRTAVHESWIMSIRWVMYYWVASGVKLPNQEWSESEGWSNHQFLVYVIIVVRANSLLPWNSNLKAHESDLKDICMYVNSNLRTVSIINYYTYCGKIQRKPPNPIP